MKQYPYQPSIGLAYRLLHQEIGKTRMFLMVSVAAIIFVSLMNMYDLHAHISVLEEKLEKATIERVSQSTTDIEAASASYDITLQSLQSPLFRTKSGIAKYYSPGMMRTVANNRGMKLRSDVHGYAAVQLCSMIGRVITASINGHKVERYQVLDCSAPEDVGRHRAQGLIIEVDYASAKRNGFLRQGKAPAKVWGYP
jgi:hypothetical protein